MKTLLPSRALALLALLLVSTLALAVSKPSPDTKFSVSVRKSDAKEEITARPAAGGRYEFSLKAAGDYIISVQDTQPKVQGTGVVGVKVGLGKNPSGAMVARATTNENGEASFKGLTEGSYFVVIQASEASTLTPGKAN